MRQKAILVNHFDPNHYSKRYKRALTFAILLFLGTLTASVLIMILSTADRHSLEDDYQATLTAVFATVAVNPTRPTGDFSFRSTGPTYRAADSCDGHVLSGLIRDQAGDPLDALVVQVWGDYVAERQMIRSGEGTGVLPGQWRVEVFGLMARRMWVQIAVQDDDGTLRYLAPPVVVSFAASDCARNHAEIIFDQVAAVVGP
ncbi:MAG: hypothetical protein JXA10_03650 [Anaerolineae bacterium]|nr:hypothetical protein [Anaerolineae bacterium]